MPHLVELLPVIFGACIGLFAAPKNRTIAALVLCLLAGLAAHLLSREPGSLLIADLLLTGMAALGASRLIRYILPQAG